MVTREELIDLRNHLIDLRDKSMDSWGEEYQTTITVGISHATLIISDTLAAMGCDLKELNDARIRSETK